MHKDTILHYITIWKIEEHKSNKYLGSKFTSLWYKKLYTNFILESILNSIRKYLPILFILSYFIIFTF